MKKDYISYAAIFTYSEDGISIDFPDLPGCCPCADRDDTDMALKNAKEALGLHIWGMEQDQEELPMPTPITAISLKSNQIPVLIDVFMPAVRERLNNRAVNRTVTLPAWLNAAALEQNINFSQVLQDALKQQLHLG